jgi:hypothetical protein
LKKVRTVAFDLCRDDDDGGGGDGGGDDKALSRGSSVQQNESTKLVSSAQKVGLRMDFEVQH